MGYKHFLLLCATLACIYTVRISAQRESRRIPFSSFKCVGRPAGYYADMETGCQVYHMCDGLGRQFSYSCPNTTLFQQRMLICDHWYMVNCSKSEQDYDANLLIGQRDKPFVTDAEMQQLRTPRPDVLSVPPKNNYYDGLKEAESKYPIHPDNSIGEDFSSNDADLDITKLNYRPSSSWSTSTIISDINKPEDNDLVDERDDNLTGAASHKPVQPFRPNKETENISQSGNKPVVSTPSLDLVPPFTPKTTPQPVFDIDARMKDSKEDAVVEFINRFDPNSPDSIKTSRTKSEIINLNQHLPAGQSSAENDGVTKNRKHFINNDNLVNTYEGKDDEDLSRFNAVNRKPVNPTEKTVLSINGQRVRVPNRELVPPKVEYSSQPSTTVGPPVYYEWKWAVPAYALEPPKISNDTENSTAIPRGRKVYGRSPFSSVTRPTSTTELTPQNVEYDVKSYVIPDYVFPLDKPHPGYSNENAMSSFQVRLNGEKGKNYGENPNCPHCHPAFVKPGTCQPCITR